LGEQPGMAAVNKIFVADKPDLVDNSEKEKTKELFLINENL
jgi:hypothetical protein